MPASFNRQSLATPMWLDTCVMSTGTSSDTAFRMDLAGWRCSMRLFWS